MILVTGANGQLGKEFQRISSKRDLSSIALSKEQLDITNFKQVECAIKNIKPNIVVNCAAYNFVDKAEEEPSFAYSINSDAVENLASVCNKFGVSLVHFSTDYVFDGKKQDFYTEEDVPNPINKYGESKLKGEQAIKKHLTEFLIFRVSWVIGRGKNNFLYKVFDWASGKRLLKISCDEVSIPTYTEDIVNLTLLSLKKGLKGEYHLTNSGYCSRFELAKYFIKKIGLNNLLIPVTSSVFNTSAKRPSFSAMLNDKISKELDFSIPEWENGVDRFVKRFKREFL
jgi:dTDP-4-dehydrorhamnose reductase